MRIIVLYEKWHTGKTTTLKNLCKKIESSVKTTNIIIAPNYANKDVTAIFEFKDKVVGITSYGDNKWVIEKPYQLFEQYNCDIIVSAGRRKNTKNG